MYNNNENSEVRVTEEEQMRTANPHETCVKHKQLRIP